MSEEGLKGGITTGSCAALGAKAAALLLFRAERVNQVDIPLPDGTRLAWPVATLDYSADGAEASIIKDAGDDPDVTHGARIRVHIAPRHDTQISFRAGSGVGIVTLPGLALAVGEVAINPVPRTMISAALREVSASGVNVTVGVDGGKALAQKTFNPKLGIEGGISIIGTSGRVRPFSAPALQQSLQCAMDICIASHTRAPVLVPGNMGRSAAHRAFCLKPRQVVEVSNEWGYMLELAQQQRFETLLMLGHPGKLAKLAMGQWNTHSAQSDSAAPYVAQLAHAVTQAEYPFAGDSTVEGLFMEQLSAPQRRRVADRLAEAIQRKTAATFPAPWEAQVVLINLKGEILGSNGNLQPWHPRTTEVSA
ncbi:MAG: cobalt-precorrin-5B (C(1))-methyltransferase CbiD [Geobacteraceae bacterium]|nr:cobalt-precorrin-5B (C(1))-methyltransferase CbiD [Geobacteraceae bacterium]